MEQMEQMEYAIFGMGLEIEIPLGLAKTMAHQGDCQADVVAAIEHGLADQLEGKENEVRQELREYGAWDDEELEDDDENNMRILWLAANNIVEEHFLND